VSPSLREQRFGTETTAEQNEKQNETSSNREPLCVTLPVMKIWFSKCVPPKQIKRDYYYSIKKAAGSNEFSVSGVLVGGLALGI